MFQMASCQRHKFFLRNLTETLVAVAVAVDKVVSSLLDGKLYTACRGDVIPSRVASQ
jgi:hypothetical protein